MAKVLVVGSEGGLGKEIVSHWKSQGFEVWGADLFKEASSDCDHYLFLDLSKDSPEKLGNWIGQDVLDQVIITSAIGYFGEFESQKNIEETVKVNFLSQVLMIKALEPTLKHGAKVLFVGSVASHMPTPDYEVYSATKLALESFVRSWRWEVKDRLDVRVFLPGAMKTSFHDKVGFKPTEKQQKSFAQASDVAIEIWKSLNKSKWRSGVSGSSALILSHRFVSPVVEKVFAWKRGQQ